MKYIVAGTYAEFKDYCHQVLGCSPNEYKKAMFIQDHEKLRGRLIDPYQDEIVYYGTYHEQLGTHTLTLIEQTWRSLRREVRPVNLGDGSQGIFQAILNRQNNP